MRRCGCCRRGGWSASVSVTSIVTVWCLWARPRAIFCPTTMTMPVLEARRWTRIGSVDGCGRRPGRAGATQLADLGRGERVGPDPQQVAGVGVEEQQRVLLDPDGHPPAAEDLRGQDDVLAQRHRAARLTVRSTSTAPPGSGGGSGDGPALRPPLAHRAARSLTDRCERSVLSRAPAMSRWITSVSAQNVTTTPARAGAEPELLAGHAAGCRWAARPGRTRPRHPTQR